MAHFRLAQCEGLRKKRRKRRRNRLLGGWERQPRRAIGEDLASFNLTS